MLATCSHVDQNQGIIAPPQERDCANAQLLLLREAYACSPSQASHGGVIQISVSLRDLFIVKLRTTAITMSVPAGGHD
jgi:hypothetical protein